MKATPRAGPGLRFRFSIQGRNSNAPRSSFADGDRARFAALSHVFLRRSQAEAVRRARIDAAPDGGRLRLETVVESPPD